MEYDRGVLFISALTIMGNGTIISEKGYGNTAVYEREM